jgi:hypothetical protein
MQVLCEDLEFCSIQQTKSTKSAATAVFVPIHAVGEDMINWLVCD